MSKQLTCPIRDVGKSFCIEENCAWWIPKGTYEVKENETKSLRTYDPTGCCAIKRMGEKI